MYITHNMLAVSQTVAATTVDLSESKWNLFKAAVAGGVDTARLTADLQRFERRAEAVKLNSSVVVDVCRNLTDVLVLDGGSSAVLTLQERAKVVQYVLHQIAHPETVNDQTPIGALQAHVVGVSPDAYTAAIKKAVQSGSFVGS